MQSSVYQCFADVASSLNGLEETGAIDKLNLLQVKHLHKQKKERKT